MTKKSIVSIWFSIYRCIGICLYRLEKIELVIASSVFFTVDQFDHLRIVANLSNSLYQHAKDPNAFSLLNIMLFPQSPHASAQDSSESSPILFLLFMALVIQILWATQGPVDLYDGGVVDTDSYMRLNRVLHLMESGNWFDSTYPRSNAPYGEVQHWTRAMDAMLIIGASVGSLVLPFSTALHWWSVIISPLFQLAALLGLMWLVGPVFSRDRMLILGGTFTLQPGVIAYYLAGRVDHHGILLFCLIMLLGYAFHMSISRLNWKTCVAAGVVAAVGVWLSIEFLIGVLVSLAFLSVLLGSLRRGLGISG